MHENETVGAGFDSEGKIRWMAFDPASLSLSLSDEGFKMSEKEAHYKGGGSGSGG